MLDSIRTRLTLAFLGLAVGPLLIVGLILTLKAYSVQTQEAVALQREMAAHLASRVQSLIRNLESEMKMLVRIEDLQELKPKRQQMVLSIFHSRQAAIDDLTLLDAGGRVLSYHSRLKLVQDRPGQSQKEMESFKGPMARRTTYFGPVRFQALSGEPLMIMAMPIIAPDSGKAKGVLVADVRLKEIWDLVARIRPGQKGASFIVDAEKRVIAHSNPSVVLRGTRFNPPGFDGVQIGLNGQKSVLVSQVISFGDQQFRIFVEAPVSEALALAIRTVHIMLTIIVIALLAAGGLGYLMARRIVRPVEEIAETARAVSAGDFSRRVVFNSRDELGVLASAFNKMTLQLETLINDLEKRVAERERAEAQVEHLKNYLSNIINSMPSVLVGMDCNQVVTHWNHQAEEVSGISEIDAIGKSITRILPDFSPSITAMQGEIEKRHPASLEKLSIEKEGERRFYDLLLYPLITNGVEGAVLRIEDVTEQTRIQELMVQTEKMMSLGGLAAGMAHEINNPLGIITQAAQNIERRVSPELPANRKVADALGLNLEGMKAYFVQRQISAFIVSILEATSRASQIITNMLRFSRRVDSNFQPSQLSLVVDQALELAGSDYDLKKKYDFRSIEIVRDYEEVPEVLMMAVEIEQVLLNLLKNAAQAIMADLPERKPRITIRIRRENRYVLLEVEDNGPGMTEDIRRRVFEPFFTTKEPGIGTGLGLSVSYMIVTQNHKGLMEVESTLDKGALFRVRLPLKGEDIHGKEKG